MAKFALRNRRSSFRPMVETLEDRCVPAVTVLENVPYVFTPADFGISDPNQSGSISINSSPGFGTLTNNGSSIGYGSSITIADIVANHVAYTPATNMSGFSDSFTYAPASSGGNTHLGRPGRYSRYILSTDRR